MIQMRLELGELVKIIETRCPVLLSVSSKLKCQMILKCNGCFWSLVKVGEITYLVVVLFLRSNGMNIVECIDNKCVKNILLQFLFLCKIKLLKSLSQVCIIICTTGKKTHKNALNLTM